MNIPKSHGYMFVIDFVAGGFDIDLITPHNAPEHFGNNVDHVTLRWDDIDAEGIHEGVYSIENLPKKLEPHAASLLARYLVKTYLPEELSPLGGNL